MQTRINTKKLIEILKANRDGHVANYETAKKLYRQKYGQALQDRLDGKVKFDSRIDLARPQNYQEDYDRAIEMLEMSEDESILLDTNQFQQYVKDEWNWTRNYRESTMWYMEEA